MPKKKLAHKTPFFNEGELLKDKLGDFPIDNIPDNMPLTHPVDVSNRIKEIKKDFNELINSLKPFSTEETQLIVQERLYEILAEIEANPSLAIQLGGEITAYRIRKEIGLTEDTDPIRKNRRLINQLSSNRNIEEILDDELSEEDILELDDSFQDNAPLGSNHNNTYDMLSIGEKLEKYLQEIKFDLYRKTKLKQFLKQNREEVMADPVLNAKLNLYFRTKKRNNPSSKPQPDNSDRKKGKKNKPGESFQHISALKIPSNTEKRVRKTGQKKPPRYETKVYKV